MTRETAPVRAWDRARKAKTHVVACIDDEPFILASLRRLLSREPYQVLTTSRPEEFLKWVEEGDISVVIVDHRMPQVEGTDLLKRVADRSPATVRVMLTGYAGHDAVVSGLDYEIQWLISKPWDDAALKETIRDLLYQWERRKQKLEALTEEDGSDLDDDTDFGVGD